MNHKKILSPEEKRQKVGMLRKQRDGLIIGNYRNILVDLFVKIREALTDDECLLYIIQEKCFAKTDHQKNIIIDYCLDLEQLGYIHIKEDGRISLTKELDF